MILWTIKQLNSVRLAIAGRQQPSHLAWGLAFGVLLGIVPHGNLLAILLLLVVLSMNLNHAMAALTAVSVTFLARRLDPYSDWVGHHLLTHPEGRRIATAAWQYPLVPWTDLNNTVVLGSLAIGLLALFPLFLISYPLFRRLGPRVSAGSLEADATDLLSETRAAEPAKDRGPVDVSIAPREAGPRPADRATSVQPASDGGIAEPLRPEEQSVEGIGPRSGESISENDLGEGSLAAADWPERKAREASDSWEGEAVRDDGSDGADGTLPTKAGGRTLRADDGQPEFEEALRFLLHQLRDSKGRDAA